MNSLLSKAIAGLPVNDQDIAEALHDICDREHSSCSSECPVFAVFNEVPRQSIKPYDRRGECMCFKNGIAMLNFLRDNQ